MTNKPIATDSKSEILNLGEGEYIIPVIQEQLIVGTERIQTGKMTIHKRVVKEDVTVNEPMVYERYEIRHVPVNKISTAYPKAHHTEDTTIIPVVKEILVIEKRYQVVEEIHVTKVRGVTPHMQEITLLKEVVTIKKDSF